MACGDGVAAQGDSDGKATNDGVDLAAGTLSDNPAAETMSDDTEAGHVL